MSRETLSLLRDISAILICFECALFVAAPGVLLFFARKYLRKGRRWLHVPLLRIQVLVLRVENVTIKASNAVAGVPIKIQTATARVRGTAKALVTNK